MRERIVESMSMEEAFKALNNKSDMTLSDKKTKTKITESIDKNALISVCKGLSSAYGKLMMDSKSADAILVACGEEPRGKKATFDEILAVVQDVLTYTPLGIGALVVIAEAIFDAVMSLVTIGLIILPVDGPVFEIITALITLIPVAPIITAVTSVPASIANRLILAARKALRKSDAEKVEKAAIDAGIELEEGIIVDTIRGGVKGALGIGEDVETNEGIIGDTIRGAARGALDIDEDADELEEGVIVDTVRGAVKGALGVSEDLKMQEGLIMDTIRGAAKGFLGEDFDDSDQKLISELLDVIESALYDFFNGPSDEEDMEEGLIGDTIRGAARGALGLN